MDKYLRILQRLRAGKPVSKEEIRFFVDFTSDVDEEKLKSLQRKSFKDLSIDEIQQMIDESGKLMLSDPSNKAKTLELAQEAEQGRVSDKIATGLNILLSGADIAASVRQINESNKLLNQNKKPARPGVPKADPYLDNAINQASQGTLNAQRAIAPVQQEIGDQYLSDLNNAKIASTGQAGTYGALAQVAANRRNRSANQLAPIYDQVRSNELGRLDNLVGMRMGQNQQNFANQASLYQTDLDQYNQALQSAGALGSTGRSNLRNSLGNFASFLPSAVSKMQSDRKYNDIYNRMAGYGDDNAKAAVNAQRELDRRFGYLTSDDDISTWEQAY